MKRKAYVCILLAALCWGLIGLFTGSLRSYGFSSGDLTFVRALGAVIVLFIYFLLTDRTIFHIRIKDIGYFIGTGIISFVFFNWCYFQCMKECSLSIAAVLLYTAPTFVVILSSILFKEKMTKKKIAALIITFIGCMFVTGVFNSEITISVVGIIFGVLSGLFYGLYSIFGRYALKKYSTYTVTFYTFLFAALGAIPLGNHNFIVKSISNISILITIIMLIVFSTVAPFLLYTKGLEIMDSGKASILASVEPVIATLVSVFILKESLSILGVVGIVLIIGSICLLKE